MRLWFIIFLLCIKMSLKDALNHITKTNTQCNFSVSTDWISDFLCHMKDDPWTDKGLTSDAEGASHKSTPGQRTAGPHILKSR